MAADGWFQAWFAGGWFPPVWFAPGDESGVASEDLRPEYHGGGRRQFADATDDDLLRLVREKWEAIERRMPVDEPRENGPENEQKSSPGKASDTVDEPVAEPPGATPPVAVATPPVRPTATAQVPPLPDPVAAAALLKQRRIEARRKRQAAAALALLLLES